MKNNVIINLVAVILVLMAPVTIACNPSTGVREQIVRLSLSGKFIEEWRPSKGKIKSITLPDGFKLGLKIEPASPEEYAQLSDLRDYIPELVKISLFDMSKQTSRLITHTYGGANSVQKLIGHDLQMTLLKPVCADIIN